MELLMILVMVSWPLVLMQVGQRVSRVLRDRQIDREIEENMWRPTS